MLVCNNLHSFYKKFVSKFVESYKNVLVSTEGI